jgi:TfoX/Sxy family transcriptional regulator of competence genes
MAGKIDGFNDFVLDQLAALSGVRSKAMFGGYGLYRDRTFFGIVHKGRLYLKTDETNRNAYLNRGMKPFQPSRKQRLKRYYEVPVEVVEDGEQLEAWAAGALSAAAHETSTTSILDRGMSAAGRISDEQAEHDAPNDETTTIWTIGHSTRSIEEFIDLLKGHAIRLLVDVRRFPASRRYPHFNQAPLTQSLHAAGILYQHMPALGGRRPTKPDSINLGWRNIGFRGYADYMQTEEFWDALKELMRHGETKRTAVMCAEAVPWRCHRNLISDALVANSWQVSHILSPARIDQHVLTSFAKVSDRKLLYPAEAGQSSLF